MQLKRSTINSSIETSRQLFDHFKVSLPAFAHWSAKEWGSVGPECDEIRECMLGWDVTDFGSDDFHNIGRTLFTLRNGKKNSRKYPKEYAEKLLIDPAGQRAPAHFHRSKREDLICIAGGNMLVQLTKADEKGQPSDEQVSVQVDGQATLLEAGAIIRLRPGMSVCIPPFTIHQFWGEEGTGHIIDGVYYTISREISSVCDDWSDNVFFDTKFTRFPKIGEDEMPRYYLCHEYPVVTTKTTVE